MITKLFKKPWFHIVLWVIMLIYVVAGPDLFAPVITKNGRPLSSDRTALNESKQIRFSIDGLEPYAKDGEQLINLYGWAFIIPSDELSIESFSREIVLISDERKYFFSVNPARRNPEFPSEFKDVPINLDTLGFNAIIAQDIIRPGKYRIGIIFKNPSTGSAYYQDKPAHFLIKTPNTITLE